MRCINNAINNQLTSKIWIPMAKMEADSLGKKSKARLYLNEELYDKLERRIKFGVLIPIEWGLNTLLEK
jgi:hypothetical protein